MFSKSLSIEAKNPRKEEEILEIGVPRIEEGDPYLPIYSIEDNYDSSYRDFTSALINRGWITEKHKSKFDKRR